MGALDIFRRASSKSSNVVPNVASPGIVYHDSDGWNGKVGPGGGYGWGAGPRTFVGGPPGPTLTHLGNEGDFPEGEHTWGPAEGDLGFPHATRWPGYVGNWEPPFYEAGNPNGGWGQFNGGPLLEARVSTVFTCVDLISRLISAMNLTRTQASGPMTGLPWMDNPEPLIYTSIVDALKAAVNSLLLRGEAIIIATARYADGTVARWVVLNPDMVTIEIGEGGIPQFFIDDVPIPRNEILHLRYQVWPGIARGIGPLEAAARNIASAAALERWGTSLAVNNGIPYAVLSTPVKLTSDQARDLKTSYAESMATRGILPVILSGGMTYTPLNLKPTDIGLLDLRVFDESRVASTFGVPLWLVGLPANRGLTYSTAQGTFDYFWRATLRAMVYNITTGLSGWALPRDQWVNADAESLVRPELSSQAEAYSKLIDKGVLDADEVRIFLNMYPRGEDTTQILAQSTEGGL